MQKLVFDYLFIFHMLFEKNIFLNKLKTDDPKNIFARKCPYIQIGIFKCFEKNMQMDTSLLLLYYKKFEWNFHSENMWYCRGSLYVYSTENIIILYSYYTDIITLSILYFYYTDIITSQYWIFPKSWFFMDCFKFTFEDVILIHNLLN